MTNKGIGNIKDYTPHFKLIIPRFNAATWHDFIESNFRSIDALLFNMFGINNFVGEWKQITTYNVGDVVFIGEDLLENGTNSEYSGRLVKVLKQHTTDDSAYFNIFYKNHPDYYELFFDANNAEYFSEKAFEYKNEANNYLKASQELNALYQQYLADTQTARDNAQASANSAATSEQNAKTASDTAVNTVKTATDLLNSTQDYTNQAINTINTTKTEAVNTITTTKEQTIQEIDTKLEETNQIIDEKITTVQDNLNTTITEAIIAAKDEVHAEADKAIENAAEEAASFAKNLLDDYVIDTVEPSLQHFVDEAETAQDNAITAQNNAQTSATASANSASKALSSENNAKTSENNAESYYNNAKEQADFAKNSADLAQDALKSITGVYRVKGSVASYTNLPISGDVGDVYNVLDTGSNYVWTDSGWDKLSETVEISWGNISGTLANQTDLQQALDDKASLTKNQTYSGTNTYNKPIYLIQGNNDKFYMKDTRVDASSATGTDTFNTIIFQDKNGFNYGTVAIQDEADGSKRIRFSVTNKLTDGTTKADQIWVRVKKDGTIDTYAPKPTDNSNDTNIAVTNWVRKLFALLTGNNTFSGLNTFTNHITQASASPRIIVKDTTLIRGQAGDGGDAKFQIVDKNNMTLGEIRVYNETNGGTSFAFCGASQNADGNQIYKSGFLLTVNPDGASAVSLGGVDKAYSKTPATADNSTVVATTAYVKAQIQEVTAAPSNPVSGVLYVSPE